MNLMSKSKKSSYLSLLGLGFNRSILVLSLLTTFVILYVVNVYKPHLDKVSADPNDPMSFNLLANPWFRSGTVPSLDGWTDATGPDGHWIASQKPGNPSPDNIEGTAARISTGRSDGGNPTIPINYDAYLYQIVSADPNKTVLSFDMYWVTHTVNPAEVTIYGSQSFNGPWEYVWKPFYKVVTKTLKPPTGASVNEWLWNYYSNSTNMVTTTLPEKGYPYYKVEVHAKLPDTMGGFKITGMYFSVTDVDDVIPTSSVPTPTPYVTVTPTPRVR